VRKDSKGGEGEWPTFDRSSSTASFLSHRNHTSCPVHRVKEKRETEEETMACRLKDFCGLSLSPPPRSSRPRLWSSRPLKSFLEVLISLLTCWDFSDFLKADTCLLYFLLTSLCFLFSKASIRFSSMMRRSLIWERGNEDEEIKEGYQNREEEGERYPRHMSIRFQTFTKIIIRAIERKFQISKSDSSDIHSLQSMIIKCHLESINDFIQMKNKGEDQRTSLSKSSFSSSTWSSYSQIFIDSIKGIV
jgi:hypothetical protein